MEKKFELIKNETGDVTAYTIRETGAVNEFTYTDFLNLVADNDKSEREVKAQLEVDIAQAQNIAQNHPIVVELEPVQQFAAGFYADLQKNIEAAKNKLEEFAVAKADNEKRRADILAQIPELGVTVSPYVKEGGAEDINVGTN